MLEGLLTDGACSARQSPDETEIDLSVLHGWKDIDVSQSVRPSSQRVVR
jgi:hypothetical protein